MRRAAAALRLLAVLAGVLYIGLYLFVAASRLAYPFELEWMEGGSLGHVSRILAGRPLYGPPTPEFVPFIYTPLYFYVSAAAAALLGGGFTPLRLVSWLASLACFALIGLAVLRATGRRLPALLAIGLFAGAYRLGGAWLDTARGDSLFLLLVLAGLHAARPGRSRRAHAAAGLLFAAAFFAKQTALLVAAPLLLFDALFERRRLGFFAAPFAGAVVAGTWMLDRLSGGWYRFYVFTLPAQHGLYRPMILGFWFRDLLTPFAVAVCLAVVWFLARLAGDGGEGRAAPERRVVWFEVFAAAGMIGSAWVSRLHDGGYDNVLLPAHAAIAVLFGLAIDAVLRLAARTPWPDLAAACLWSACLVQFATVSYNPAQQIPRAEDRAAGLKLVEAIRRIPGDVLIPNHGYLAVLAGKRDFAHGMAVSDLLRGAAGPAREDLVSAFREALRRREFAAVIIDQEWFFKTDLERDYDYLSPVFQGAGVFWPVTGARTRPASIYVPRAAPGAAAIPDRPAASCPRVWNRAAV
jgi:hypothetical protein